MKLFLWSLTFVVTLTWWWYAYPVKTLPFDKAAAVFFMATLVFFIQTLSIVNEYYKEIEFYSQAKLFDKRGQVNI